MDGSNRTVAADSLQIIDLIANPRARRCWPGNAYAYLSPATGEETARLLTHCPVHRPTPLVALPGAAHEAGVGSIHYKDESHRFSLKSFKSMGALIGAARRLVRHLDLDPDDKRVLGDLFDGKYRDRIRGLTLTAATAGNHGRAVAAAARVFGIDAVIYVPEGTKAGRITALQAEGAEVRVYPGPYDDAVREAEREAQQNGWMVISDTAYPGYHQVPRDIMSGYCAIGHEILATASEIEAGPPPFTHIFLQGGVGSLSGALAGYFANQFGPDRPVAVIVEPAQADCIATSVKAGERTAIDKDLATSMAGLACSEVSEISWPVLRDFADFCVTLPDTGIAPVSRALAESRYGETPIEAGESAVAGLIAALATACDDRVRDLIGLAAESRILVIGTEGATDPEAFERMTERKPWVNHNG